MKRDICSKNFHLFYIFLLITAATAISRYLPAAKNSEIIRPVATHGMAMVFGYVTQEQYEKNLEIEPLIYNPLTRKLENSTVITRLADLFNQDKAYILTNTSLFRTMLKKYPNIRLEDWRCKAVSDFVYLFIRNSLLPPDDLTNATAQIPTFEAIEPYLGIKISDKTTISTAELRSSNYSKMPSKNLADECSNIVSCFWDGTKSKIFITKSAYASETYQKMSPIPIIPTWAFLLYGIGKQSQNLNNPDGLVCGLLIPTFRQFLDFCTSQINIGMMITCSSYFSDINMIAVLKEANGKTLKKYPFSISSTPIVAAPILCGQGADEPYNYQEFFAKLLPPPTTDALRVNWQPNSENFEDVVNLACRPYQYTFGAEKRATTPAAIPSFRPANEQFFVPANFDGSVAVISDNLIKPGLEKIPLYTRELTLQKTKNVPPCPNILLLTFSKSFTRPLVLTKCSDGKIPTIMGINQGPSVYIFEECDAQGSRISDIIDAFLRVPMLEQNQAFVIKKLHALNDIDKLVPVNKPEPEKSYFELKIVHKRPEVGEPNGKNLIVIKQFDCTKNCTEKNTTPVAAVTNSKELVESKQKNSTPEQTKIPVNEPLAPIPSKNGIMKVSVQPAPKDVGPSLKEITAPVQLNYNIVASAQGDCKEDNCKWSAINPTNASGLIDNSINEIQAQQISQDLRMFAS